jgi:predicted nucleic acid-binding protein
MTDDPKFFMLDTNVFNRLCDGVLSLDCLRCRRLMATGIQEAELRNTPDETRRSALLDAFEIVRPDWVPAAQFVFDMAGAGWGQGSWGLNDGTNQAMLTRLKQMEGEKNKWTNQVGDVLIAETAMRHGAVLVSGDSKLRTMASEFGVEVMSIEDFARE